jgi:AraC-like DNA-binding protein
VYDYAGEIILGGTRHPLKAGSFTITPAHVPSTYDLPHSGHHWCVHFAPVRSASTERVPIPLYGDLGSHKAYAAERIMQIGRIHRQSDDRGIAGSVAAAYASVMVQELLLWLAMHADPAAGSHRKHERSAAASEKAAALMDAHFSRDNLTVPELADAVGMTQNYLAWHFRRRYGMTMPRYLLNRRIEHAGLLLATTDLPVTRIAQRVGFTDPQHFNKQFRRIMGLSPTAYRDNR